MKPYFGCLVLLVASSQLLFAGAVNPDDIYLNLSMPSCSIPEYCGAVIIYNGSPTQAWANFAPIDEPYSFNYETGPALSWTVYQHGYEATYGSGGYFDITGPDGLTFTGVVLGGTTYCDDLGCTDRADYSGEWSNGQYAQGSAYVVLSGHDGQAYLESEPTQTTPEPSTLLLLGSGVLGVLGLKKRL